MKYLHKNTFTLPLLTLLAISFIAIASVAIKNVANAAPVVGFEAGRIIDDDVFTANGSMNVNQIQAFLNSKVPSCDTWGTQPSEYGGGTRAQWAAARGYSPPFTCLRDFSEGGRSAAQIIYDAAQQYRINPQVLIVLLQKEQGLVTDTWPLSKQYRTATGYGCPDTAACDTTYYGFTNQINWASKMFRAIMDASPSWYTPYVMGNNYIRWNPSSSCGGSTVNIQTRSTQALYNYTPYQPNQAALNAGYGTGNSCSAYGNRNFYLYFTDWFGSTKGNSYYTCRNGSNLTGVASGPRILADKRGGVAEGLSLTVANNTGTACAEVHSWANGSLQGWSQHIGTNSYTFNPTASSFAIGELSHAISRFYKIDYAGTASNRLEVHEWNATVQQWERHVATASGTLDPATSEVITGDFNGDGLSEFYIVNYANTGSGMVEIHGFTRDLQRWTLHAATNLPAIDPSKGKVVAADLDGDGRDEFTYVQLGNVQSGRVETHTWAPNLQQWVRHTATVLPAAGFNKATEDIMAADLDGDGRDNLYYTKYSGTQSGRIEVHGFTRDQQGWISHIATSAGAF